MIISKHGRSGRTRDNVFRGLRAGRDPAEKCGLMALLLFGGLVVLGVVLWISTGRPRTWLTVRRHRRRRYR
jgi:hypothetical protein